MERKDKSGGRRLSTTVLAVGAAALSAAAFAAYSLAQDGGSDGNGETPQGEERREGGPRGPLSDEDRQAFEAFKECMSEQGVEPPERGSRTDGPPSEQERDRIRQAFEACSDELPEGARLPGPGHGPGHHGPCRDGDEQGRGEERGQRGQDGDSQQGSATDANAPTLSLS